MEQTPMLKQYLAIKKQYQDCLLLYRMGDFYELFQDDAYIGAKVLDITLTGKANGKAGRIPMAGVPFHAIDSYLSKLVKAGYKVAICEQVSEPNKYGLVDREVIRIVTPGTILDEKTLEKKENNYIVAISIDKKNVGIAAADISTGQFLAGEYTLGNLDQILLDELSRLHPSECILEKNIYDKPEILKILHLQKGLNVFCYQDWEQFADKPKKILQKYFGLSSLVQFEIEHKLHALKASAALLGYLQYTQKEQIHHFKSISQLNSSEYMILDRNTILNLELFSTIREHDIKGTLVHHLDKTVTAMGGRTLREWIRKPLTDKKEIGIRLDTVEKFITNNSLREIVRDYMKEIVDIERLISRLSVGIGNAKDLISLKNSLKKIVTIKEKFVLIQNPVVQKFCKTVTKNITTIISSIDRSVLDEPRFNVKEGGIIKSNINNKLDELRDLVGGNRTWVTELEKSERKRSGINTLKIRFNKIFGFYIEVSKANSYSVPTNYIRKQTLVNSERFITPELKEKEKLILTAEEEINKIEYEIFLSIVSQVLGSTNELQIVAHTIGILDCILNFSYIAEHEHYSKPTFNTSGEINIIEGRHPVVEKLIEDHQFVPNDVKLNSKDHQLLMITGPNMAGKSVYIRQVAHIVLMAQMGSYVPAQEASLSIIDRIFVRSGASDVITSGLSTFMVEMVETAQILHQMTDKSLIIMDEIGRGTSTYDGISIAQAVAEYLISSNVHAKILFATHYHELQKLEDHFPKKVKNYHMAVEEYNNEPIFLHTITSGGASHSYGVAVAKLAGVPEKVTKRAYEILNDLEKRDSSLLTNNLPVNQDVQLKKLLKNIDINTLTPIQALNTLAKMKEKYE